MADRVIDVDLENFQLMPKACAGAMFWELIDIDPDVDASFEKEEWFSSTLLEWGRCGKFFMEGRQASAFVEYAPSTLFPRLAEFPAARAASRDSAYLAYCFVEEGRRGRGLGSTLVKAAARDLVDRGYGAVEAIGDREWDGESWVLPAAFLVANRFRVVREHVRFPLLRLDLREAVVPTERQELAVVPIASH